MTAAALMIDDLVGPYRILGELGGGGMGMVYRAEHVLLRRPAAIKVLRPEFGGYAMSIQRFLTEARATTAVRHPGIVEVYDYGHTAGGHAFIAMELLEGKTLGTRLAQEALRPGGGALPVVEALRLTRRIAAPLAAAHERGIVHRDLKPDNVFLIRDHEGGAIDQVKLLDFGIAKLDSTATSHRTTIGLVLGTPSYMSPEQCLGTSDCDHRTDLYALGCIVFEMLAGRPPYHAMPTAELFAAHIHHPIPDLGKLVKVPPDVSRLVTRLLAKCADDRPASAFEVVAEVDRILAMLERQVGVVSLPARRSSLRFAIVVASGIAISLSAIGAWYRFWRSGGRSDATALGPRDASITQTPTIERIPIAVGTNLPAAPLAAPGDAAIEAALDAAIDASMNASSRKAPAAAPSGVRGQRTPSRANESALPPSVPSTKPDDVVEDLGKASTGGVDTPVQDVVDKECREGKGGVACRSRLDSSHQGRGE